MKGAFLVYIALRTRGAIRPHSPAPPLTPASRAAGHFTGTPTTVSDPPPRSNHPSEAPKPARTPARPFNPRQSRADSAPKRRGSAQPKSSAPGARSPSYTGITASAPGMTRASPVRAVGLRRPAPLPALAAAAPKVPRDTRTVAFPAGDTVHSLSL